MEKENNPVCTKTGISLRNVEVGQYTEKADAELARAQEVCESPGGRPGLPSLISLRFQWT